MIRVLIADDHPIFRDGLRRLIEDSPGMEVVGEAATGQEVIEVASKLRPQVVVCDVRMPGRGAIETIQELKRLLPEVTILMLTGQPEDHFALRCLKEGAAGYMTKGSATDQLIDAIRKVASGGRYISETLAEMLVLTLDKDRGASPHERLSDREFQVMSLIAMGKTPKEIAEELILSVKTVSTYRARILEKMSLKNNAELMLYAVREGLVS
jgi:DNA-binding NarL/FixJ family response regulator